MNNKKVVSVNAQVRKEIIDNLFNNINWLLRYKSIRKGDFEQAVGVARGYMSRAKKIGSSPSLEFIVNTADYLHITLDKLLKSDIKTDAQRLNDMEITIITLINKIIEQTEKHNIHWQEQEYGYYVQVNAILSISICKGSIRIFVEDDAWNSSDAIQKEQLQNAIDDLWSVAHDSYTAAHSAIYAAMNDYLRSDVCEEKRQNEVVTAL